MSMHIHVLLCVLCGSKNCSRSFLNSTVNSLTTQHSEMKTSGSQPKMGRISSGMKERLSPGSQNGQDYIGKA